MLFLLCAGNEGCWIGLYMLHWTDAAMFGGAGTVARALLAVCGPLSAIKQFINVVQWWEALCTLANHDLSDEEAKKLKKT